MMERCVIIVYSVHRIVRTKLFESKNRINSNVTLPIWGGDLVFDISGEIDDANMLKSIMLFRRYY